MKRDNGHMERSGINSVIIAVIFTVVLGTFFCFFYFGGFIHPAGRMENGLIIKNTSTQAPFVIDAEFSISEANISIIDFKPVAHVSYEDLKKYPELERSMHSDINSTRPWHSGTRLVNIFKGNLSRFYAVVDDICEGRPLAECNCGMLFEYHGDYYLVSFQEYNPDLYRLAPTI